MEDYREIAPTRLDQPPAARWNGRKWLMIGGLALAILLALGVGALLGSSTGTTQAATLAVTDPSSSQTLAVAQSGAGSSGSFFAAPGLSNGGNVFAAGPRAQGQCEAVTVSSVNGNTIVAKTASGSTVTIHTTASTQYTQAGKSAAASAIKVGSRILVMGTHNSDGSISATSIDIIG